jgi:hypothetical protein
VKFEETVDGLGEVWWCPVRFNGGTEVLLNRYIGSPDEVVVSSGGSS